MDRGISCVKTGRRIFIRCQALTRAWRFRLADKYRPLMGVNDDVLNVLLREARTYNAWLPKPVLARSNIAHVEVLMNSKTLPSAETWTEIARLFARLALGVSFLSAVADRFGFWGPYGAKNVSWGDFAHFVEYTRSVTALFPSSLTETLAWSSTIGFYHRGDAFGRIANRRHQNTHYLGPLWFSALVICYRHGYRSRHQDAVRLFGFLGGRCRIFAGILGA